MPKTKTSIYIDKELWWEFKKKASEEKREVSELLEEVIREELLEDFIIAIENMTGEHSEIYFKPLKIKSPISKLVREMRNERADSIS
ncbi:hypothetical protein [Thermococcus barophilus]|uniref:CopG family transcriptional regulator n=1 Tax=Thermococcus barophilus TaxID=55802 RepID=A0A0S1XCI4_THEBA|nr:hypothetical protein [Thermococcus barophilus]ALM75464.1 hypothetical protein TBCH5v1_1550 [Thermococcus barophilus]